MIPASSTIYPSVGAGVCKISISDAFAASTQDVKDIADANASADAPKPSLSRSIVPAGFRCVSFFFSASRSFSTPQNDDVDVDDDDDGDEGNALHFVVVIGFVARALSCCFPTKRLAPILLENDDDDDDALVVFFALVMMVLLLMDVVIVLLSSVSSTMTRSLVEETKRSLSEEDPKRKILCLGFYMFRVCIFFFLSGPFKK
tara:strand:- start:1812 stop:2417 length:606 start_codon:yes stop_codon:yes gene_type:complete